MDAMEVLTNLDQIHGYFQPIFSADAHTVIGYEVSGRLQMGEQQIHLDDFLNNEDIPEEYRIDMEHKILHATLAQVSQIVSDVDIYIPSNPNLLMQDFGESHFTIIQHYIPEKHLSRVVLVIAEHHFRGDVDRLHHALRYFTTFGVKVALQGVGAESHLERIALLEPQILKVNIHELNYNSWSAQADMISAIGSLAHKIGANLLFEGIETVYQLQFAWKNGGRFYQGPYLANTNQAFIEKDILKERFKEECQKFIVSEKKMLEAQYMELKKLREKLENKIQRVKPSSDDLSNLLQLAQQLEDCSFRLYICNEDGFQLTPNIMRKDNRWELQPQAINKNWSWRPYFLQTIIKMRNDQSGEISELYRDIETGEITRTFSTAINEHEYLFIDLSYDYLYEHGIFR
ncbi:EAL domain-containing protein [Lysinibacillus piscis]|uniref:EAL-domain containing protein YkuI n=1 Tax=Lysinibacillus piscis TaxID=2518931 RepID=A0ABQ5NKU1_9BACI|nr:EAL domain-containing protein [Lysinibacillus sp. KH24]GLC88980.1 putative EAL-domain containing protein YkuI [Lysinibacillus sp. KH24]